MGGKLRMIVILSITFAPPHFLMHTWHWRTWQDLPYLTCSLLDPWKHGFFTQHFWPRSPAELTPVLEPTAQAYRVRQVHGNQVLTPSEVDAAQAPVPLEAEQHLIPAADGLLTDQANQAVWSCTADCTPILIGDRQTGQVAAVHAGWRGTAAKILPLAIARFQNQGSDLANLCIALGPAIAGEVYQVSAAVAAEVGASVLAQIEDSDSILPTLHQLPHSPILSDDQPGHVRLDVRRVNALQLEGIGIAPTQIAIAPHCTYQDPQNFFSYRRDHQKQVQWSGIVSRHQDQTKN